MGFINETFLLGNEYARELFFNFAKDCPVVDFHNHLPIKDVHDDRRYEDIGTLWVCHDPYKHRAMRLMGLDERLISGEGSSKEKFDAWCGIFPYLIGNPLYHWSLLELKRYFGIDDIPAKDNSDKIWERCGSLLKEDGYSMVQLLRRVNVVRMSTSDDLLDDTLLHKEASDKSAVAITPSLRGDTILTFSPGWIERLGVKGESLEDFLAAVELRLDLFGKHGCRLADHALDNGFTFIPTTFEKASALFMRRENLSASEKVYLVSYVLGWLGSQYARRGWVMQLHLGAERWTSSRLRAEAGPAGGFACPGSGFGIKTLCDFLDYLDRKEELPKTILYPLNPSDNASVATVTGSFSESGVQKIKFGPAWWYNDHQYGIEANLEVLSSYSLLSQSVGMTTDSRSVLSFSRHEYFRRILCNWLGEKIEKGLLPDDIDFIGTIVENICYKNAENWIYENK